jgi:hypothetical protein
LAGADGGVYAFGDAPFAGGLTGAAHRVIVGMSATRTGQGYWLVAADGGVFSFGDAEYFGSVGATNLNEPVVAVASGSGYAIPVTPSAPVSTVGFDISWPQCGRLLPAPPYGFGVVGVTGGHLFSTNPCVRDQWRWATDHGSFAGMYLNTNAPTPDELAAFAAGPALSCQGKLPCVLYQWGHQAAADALRSAGDLPAPRWWLDVETANVWAPDPDANAVILRGVIDGLRSAGKEVGVYSTASQWATIAGAFSPGLPTWVAGAPGDQNWCAGHSFGGGTAWMVQLLGGTFDTDVLCPAGNAQYKQVFAAPRPLTVPVFTAAASKPVRPVPPSVPLLGVSGEAVARAAQLVALPPVRHVPPHHSGWPWLAGAVVVLGFLGLSGATLRARGDRP